MRFGFGFPVRVEMTKWGNRPHWEFAGLYLGADLYGDWVGVPVGTRVTRPGAETTTGVAQVVLIPPAVGWVATFHAPGGVTSTYVDTTSVPYWDGSTCRAVDLDLDVILDAAGGVLLDDEDEFADHQVLYGYTPAAIGLARESAGVTFDAVVRKVAPFDHVTPRRWFAFLGTMV